MIIEDVPRFDGWLTEAKSHMMHPDTLPNPEVKGAKSRSKKVSNPEVKIRQIRE
jgi:hypothetical protein